MRSIAGSSLLIHSFREVQEIINGLASSARLCCSQLVRLVKQHGVRKWSYISRNMFGRIGKQCRERWHNHLRPDIKVLSSLLFLSMHACFMLILSCCHY